MNETIEESFQDGYNTGLAWKETYTPGGPWRFSAYSHESEAMQEKAERSQKIHDAWMAGFKAGLEKKNRS